MDPRRAALVERLQAGGVLYVMHANADPDCVGAAFALAAAWPGAVAAPAGVSKAGALLAARLGLAPDPWPHPERFASVVAVDTSSRTQLGRLGPLVATPLLVDHHRYGDLLDGAPAAAWDPTRTSCCEVALDLLDEAGKPPGKDAAFGLLAGLVADTQQLRLADARTLRAAARLVEASGATLAEARAAIEDEPEPEDSLSRRKAQLVAASRAEVETVGASWLVARSEVGAYDADAAWALVRAGADVALVRSGPVSKPRISLRANARAVAAGLHLGEVANAAAREVGWSGGGHDAAAGLSGDKDPASAEKAVRRGIQARLTA